MIRELKDLHNTVQTLKSKYFALESEIKYLDKQLQILINSKN